MHSFARLTASPCRTFAHPHPAHPRPNLPLSPRAVTTGQKDTRPNLDDYRNHNGQEWDDIQVPAPMERACEGSIELEAPAAPSLLQQLGDLMPLQSLLQGLRGGSDEQPEPSKGVKGFACHPFRPRWALALGDDSIRFYDHDRRKWQHLSLWHPLQAGIREISYSKMGGNLLAAACDNGVCLWKLTTAPTRDARSRNGMSGYMTFLRPAHEKTDCARFSPCGRYLVTSSAHSSKFVVWDVTEALTGDGRGATPMQVVGENVLMSRWSPAGDALLTASSSALRVWRVRDWSSSVWDIGARPKNVHWSADGRVVLVNSEHSSVVHSIDLTVGGEALQTNAVLNLALEKEGESCDLGG